jgi:hypothetical protein
MRCLLIFISSALCAAGLLGQMSASANSGPNGFSGTAPSQRRRDSWRER